MCKSHRIIRDRIDRIPKVVVRNRKLASQREQWAISARIIKNSARVHQRAYMCIQS